MNIIISAKHLSFHYGKDLILKDLSFSLQNGVFYSLLGRNGAGKSTLLRCLLGLSPTYQGEVLINGISRKDYSPKRLASYLAYIPQEVTCIYDYTVLQYVLMGRASYLPAYQNPGTRDKAIALKALSTIGIDSLANRSMNRLSGGERQLAAIARALTQQSPILLMDEPTAGLDYGNQIRFMLLAQELARKGHLVLMSCHNPHQVHQFTDRVLVLEEGRLAAFGPAKRFITPELIKRIYRLGEIQIPC